MTLDTATAMQNLQHAIRAQLLDELRTWWNENRQAYEDTGDPAGAIEDAILTLEKA